MISFIGYWFLLFKNHFWLKYFQLQTRFYQFFSWYCGNWLTFVDVSFLRSNFCFFLTSSVLTTPADVRMSLRSLSRFIRGCNLLKIRTKENLINLKLSSKIRVISEIPPLFGENPGPAPSVSEENLFSLKLLQWYFHCIIKKNIEKKYLLYKN